MALAGIAMLNACSDDDPVPGNPTMDFQAEPSSALFGDSQMCIRDRSYKLLLTLLVLLMSTNAFAQRLTATGKVTDAAGREVIGASVLEKGTANGVVTNLDGEFSLSVGPVSYTHLDVYKRQADTSRHELTTTMQHLDTDHCWRQTFICCPVSFEPG